METLNGEAKALQRKVDTFDPARNGYKEVSLSMVCQWSLTCHAFFFSHAALHIISHISPDSFLTLLSIQLEGWVEEIALIKDKVDQKEEKWLELSERL